MSADYPGDYEAAVAFLDRRIGDGIRPGLERIRQLLELIGDPHLSYPVVHVAGTNGKTTVVRMISDILGAHGLFVGSFTSPHLHRVEDRYAVGGASFGPTHLARAVEDIAPFVMMQEEQFGESPTYFELTAAVGFAAFSVDAVDAAVIEVGLGGRYDATNVVRADVSVITGISLDHTAYLGDTEREIAARVDETSATWHRAPEQFRAVAGDRDERGWVVAVEGLYRRYDDLVLGIHGRHQTTHLATAVATCEAFFGRALDESAVREVAAALRSPGRLEVAGHLPTILIDGAHNEEGFAGLARDLDEEFEEEEWTLVLGVRGDRDVASLVAPLRGRVSRVIATQADDHLAVAATAVAEAAGTALEVPAEVVSAVPDALEKAITKVVPGAGVVVAGSLYVIGEARHSLGLDDSPSPVHRRFEAPVGE